ncbi:unnamed protein product [Blepharisma stoltei]|uniref:Uncharacterized protein n=1 Tax=Blepharisma stoltei TaxID=1481888 RepID=A0AAU9J775_9CILI|nr:unnamed protein product [Blepharisma stoltei]
MVCWHLGQGFTLRKMGLRIGMRSAREIIYTRKKRIDDCVKREMKDFVKLGFAFQDSSRGRQLRVNYK